MTQNNTPQNNPLIQKRKFSLRSLRFRVAKTLLEALFGRPMHITSAETVMVSGVAVLWYLENGVRKFLTVRENSKAFSRFIACVENRQPQPLNVALKHAMEKVFGPTFTRAFDENLLELDRVAAAPMLAVTDPVTGEKLPVQTLCWVIQITPEQAQLCTTQVKGTEILAIPEFGMMSQNVDPAHKIIYQAVQRHLNEEGMNEPGVLVDRLEEFLKKMGNSHRTLH